jgi:hypothetical protein
MVYLENFNKAANCCKIGAPALVGSATGTPQVPLFLAPGWPRSPASTSSSGSLGPAALLYETGPSPVQPPQSSNYELDRPGCDTRAPCGVICLLQPAWIK